MDRPALRVTAPDDLLARILGGYIAEALRTLAPAESADHWRNRERCLMPRRGYYLLHPCALLEARKKET